MFPDYSRSRLKEWLLAGAITVEGGPKRPRDAVSGGETIEFEPVSESEVRAEPEPITLDVVYEDEDLLVVNKPAGLVVHPGAGNPGGTLMNGLLHHAPQLEQVPRAGIIHRIDKDTTGLLLIAKTLPAHTALVRQLAEREIARNYLAVCNGVLTGGGTINQPIGRHPVDRKRMSVQQDFAWRRHALVGDPVYGGRLALPKGASEPVIEMLRRFKRQALHATRLAFEHPSSRETIELEVPPPADFQALLKVLREDMP
jgi:23S rRNA pseudouridine1911/1915/1917 synthase